MLFLALVCTCAPSPPEAAEVPASDPDLTVVDTEKPYAEYSFVSGKRFGLIPAGATIEDVEKLYGADLTAGTVYGAEGMELPGHYLFKGTDAEVIIFSEGGDSLLLELRNPGGPWYDAETLIRVGTSLKQLERLNGNPFIFYGFGWDFGGNIYDWQGGDLEAYALELTYDHYGLGEEEIDDFIGDQPVRSDAENLEYLSPRVGRLFFSLY